MVLVLKLSWHALVASKLVLDTWQGMSYQATSDANGWGKWVRDPRLPACRIVLPKTWRISKDCTMSHLPQPCLMRNCSTLDNRCSFYIKKFWYWNIPMSARHYLGHTIGKVTSSRQDESFQGFKVTGPRP